MLADLGINQDHFRRASEFVQTKFDGAWRPIALRTPVETVVKDRDLRLRFTLPPGHYATTVCREYMKADPVRMI
jgi:tRNA pseudouridine13 synthase